MSGVLHALGHHRSGELLKFECEVKLARIGRKRRSLFGFAVRATEQKRVAKEIECRRIDLMIQPHRPVDRIVDEGPVAIGVLSAVVNVRSINRGAGDRLANHRLKNIVR